MGSVAFGRYWRSCSNSGIVSSKRAMRKAPLPVVGRILTRFSGVVWSVSLRRRSSERRSVKSLVFLTGTSFKAFLIQKTSIKGQAVKLMKSQPREL